MPQRLGATSTAWLVAAAAAVALLGACSPKAGGGGTPSPAAGGGPIQADAVTWASYSEPTEQAFSAQVPQGWKIDAGVVRTSASVAKPWLTVASPDAASVLFMGDPTLPIIFVSPSAYNVQEGEEIQGSSGGMTAMDYRSGVDFAQLYGKHTLPTYCDNVQAAGTKPEPELAAQASGKLNSNAQVDAGMARFTCQIKGHDYDAGIIFTDTLFSGGAWAANVIGYRAPKGQGGDAERILLKMAASEQPNPAWVQGIIAAQNEEGAAARQRIRESWDNFGVQMRQQQDAFAAQMQQSHDAYLAASQQAADARNANFAAHEYNKGVQTRDFILMVRGHHLQANPSGGPPVEVPD